MSDVMVIGGGLAGWLAAQAAVRAGCGMPESLFLALHTVSEHLKEMNHG